MRPRSVGNGSEYKMPHKRKEPLSATEVNAEIWYLVQRCNELLKAYHGAGEKLIAARDGYDDRYARELLSAPEGTVQEKKAIADQKSREEYLQFIQAETKYKYLKMALDTTRDQMTALESIGSNMRQENDLQKYSA